MNDIKVVCANKFEDIFKQTVDDMRSLGTYKVEFSPAITRYAEMRVQYEINMERWYAGGCKMSEQYTNKAGATNERKTALYQSLENLRKELTELENIFGLTPSGLRKIKNKAMEQKKESTLAKVLSEIG